MTEDSLHFVSVHTLENRFEGDVIVEALEQEGIPTLLRPFEETPYTGLFVPQKGWGRIMVPKEMEGQAREIISSFEIANADTKHDGYMLEIDPDLWTRLRQSDPDEVVNRAVVEHDPENNVYIVPFLNSVIFCFPESEKIEIAGELESFGEDPQLGLVLLHYLLGAQEKSLSSKWVSEKDLPSGSIFFTAAHALPVEPLASAFNEDPQSLKSIAPVIGGKKANLGDLSYQFQVFPRIPILVILWIGDDEFEPSFHILYDQTIITHFPSLDIVWGLANVFIRILTYSSTLISEPD